MAKEERNKNTQKSTRDLYYSSPANETKINLTTTIIVCFITLAVGFGIGINWTNFLPYLSGSKTTTTASLDFSSLNELYQTLVENYDGKIDTKRVIEEAKRGLVTAAGDTYTYYMTADETREFNKDLSGDVGAGVGVEIGERDGFVKVLRTTPDNPARKAGVLAGDIVYKVDGEDVTMLSLEDVANKMRGVAGTEVKLTVVRDNKEVEFKLKREIINNVSAYIDYKGDAAILTITRFDKETGTLAENLAKEAKARNVKKIILDLRGNGGGYVDAAQEVASLWLNGGVVTEQRSQNGIQNRKYYAKTNKAVLADIKTYVLTNGSTASASEIVAGALKERANATLIGEKTYGKGSVQSLESLPGGETLRVTIAKWYTPNGQNINGEGISPDIEVERTYDQINKEIDPQLDKALEM